MPLGVNLYDEERLQSRNVANANAFNIVSPGIVEDGLVLHLDAGNRVSYPTSGTLWYDLTDNRNNGTLTNGPTFSLENGGSVVFDGTNDYAQCSASSNYLFAVNNFAVDCWFMITGNAALNNSNLRDAALFHIGDNTSITTFSLVILGSSTTTGTGIQVYQNSPNTTNISITSTVLQNAWHHVCVTKYNDSIFVYFNNALISTTANSSSWGSASYPIVIGELWRSAGSGYKDSLIGRIVAVRIYNRALTPTEVSQNFNATRARFGV